MLTWKSARCVCVQRCRSCPAWFYPVRWSSLRAQSQVSSPVNLCGFAGLSLITGAVFYLSPLYCFLWSQEKVWAFSLKPGSKRGQRWVRSPDAWCHLNTSTCTRTTTWCGRWGDVHVQTALFQLSCFGVFLFPWIFFLEQLCVFHNEK